MSGIGAHGTSLEIARLTRWRGEGRVARVLAIVTVASALLLMFAPWRQSAVGHGRVIAWSPNERELVIQAPIDGRVVDWRFQEGDHVEQGEVIVELADNDPQAIQRFETERDAVVRQIEAAEASIEALSDQVESLERVRGLRLEAADAKIRMAQSQARAAELELEAATARQRAAELQVERMAALADEGLESQRQYELAQRNVAEARAATMEGRAAVEAAHADVAAARAARESQGSEVGAKIASARSGLESARSKRAQSEERLAQVERALARQRSLLVRAPRSGMLIRVRARENSAFVRPGERLAVLVPDTYRRAVELTVSGVDAPLVVAGQTVTLQFEGWPAIQFGGWPEAAAGTFTGKVAFVEPGATPQGRFRVVVVPAEDGDWPPPEVLRQGNRANGWVLLNEVTLGYELWRLLNGFPADLPSRTAEVGGIGARKAKPGR